MTDMILEAKTFPEPLFTPLLGYGLRVLKIGKKQTEREVSLLYRDVAYWRWEKLAQIG
jgi:hypothetical protein